MKVISARNLSKKFQSGYALKDVSFDVDREKVAILGYNGAGKSTLAKIIAGVMKQSSGRLTVLNSTPSHPEVRRRIGLVTHNPMLYPDLTVGENLRFYSRLFGVDDFEVKLKELSRDLGFENVLDERVANLSRGYTQRIAVARALLSSPEILIMDEATSGLDVRSRKWILSFMEDMEGTLIFTTHLMKEAEFCDRFIVLNAGEILYDGEEFEEAKALLESEE